MEKVKILAEEIGRRINWFIKLRWIATGGVLLAVLIARLILNIQFSLLPILFLVLWLIGYNTFFHFMSAKSSDYSIRKLLIITRIQVIFDLLTLVLLLYFSGGVENPFSVYLIFHTVIVDILLTERESFIITTSAVALYTTMVLLDYSGFIPHFPLANFYRNVLHKDIMFVLTTIFVLATTLYIVRYFTTSIVRKLNARTSELVTMNQKLQKADEERVQAVLLVTHELRVPLSSIEGLLGLILKGYVTDKKCMKCKVISLVKRANTRVKNLLTLSDDLLHFHKMEIESTMFKRAFIDLEKIIDSVIKEQKDFARRCNVSIRKMKFGNLPSVQADFESIKTIVSNLISNAIKYNVPNGKITLAAKQLNGQIEVYITDTGVGISEEDLSRVFDLFYQGDYARRKKKTGVGLGLSLVKKLVESQGGNIFVESKWGKGSKFTFTLPVSTQARGSYLKVGK